MRVVAIHGPGDIRIDTVTRPNPGPNEVLVKVEACGICGSDLPRAFGDGAHFYPVVVGHEAAGEVVEIGHGVSHLQVGDRVAIAPLVPCLDCQFCQQGMYSLCTSYSFIGSRQQGCMAEYVSVPSRCLLKIPKELSYEKAALVEPATVSLHILLRVAVAGSRVVVLGTGTIGLLAVQWAKFLGAAQVIAVDIDDFKLEIAKQTGADVVLNSRQGTRETLAQLKEATCGHMADIVVETAGKAITQVQSIEMAASSGNVLYVGTAEKDVHVPARTFEMILRKELTILGSWMSYSPPFPGKEWSMAIEALAQGRIKVEKLITHRFGIDEAVTALEVMRDGVNTVKVMLLCSQQKQDT
jgi:L-iditol 2-dehydrogenase